MSEEIVQRTFRAFLLCGVVVPFIGGCGAGQANVAVGASPRVPSGSVAAEPPGRLAQTEPRTPVSVAGLDAALAQAVATAGDTIRMRTGAAALEGRVFRTTRSQFARFIGATLNTDEAVAVVLAEGEFVDGAASLPYGDGKTNIPAPSGKVAVVVVDLANGEVLDWGLLPSASPPGMEAVLGSGVAFAFPAQGRISG